MFQEDLQECISVVSQKRGVRPATTYGVLMGRQETTINTLPHRFTLMGAAIFRRLPLRKQSRRLYGSVGPIVSPGLALIEP